MAEWRTPYTRHWTLGGSLLAVEPLSLLPRALNYELIIIR